MTVVRRLAERRRAEFYQATKDDESSWVHSSSWHEHAPDCRPSDLDPTWCNEHARYLRRHHYVALADGTTWPVNVEDVEWQLRHGEPTRSDLLVAASVLNLYARLVDPTVRSAEAEVKLKKARAAQRDAP